MKVRQQWYSCHLVCDKEVGGLVGGRSQHEHGRMVFTSVSRSQVIHFEVVVMIYIN